MNSYVASEQYLKDVANAIRTKMGDNNVVDFSNLSNIINNLPSGSSEYSYGVDFTDGTGQPFCGDKVTNMYYAFCSSPYVTEAICGNNVENMYSAFSSCGNLTSAVW